MDITGVHREFEGAAGSVRVSLHCLHILLLDGCSCSSQANRRLTQPRQLKNPSITTGTSSLYFTAPAALEEQTRPNLKRKLDEMIQDGEEVNITDPAFATAFKFKLSFRD